VGLASTLSRITSPDDAELVRAAQAGNRQALEDLLREHYDRVYAVCRRLTGNDADAADAAQETMISLVRNLDGFDGRSRFSTWAYRVAINASLDELRRRRRRPRPVDDRDGPVRPAVVGTDEGAVDDRLAVDAALRRLPIEFRAAVVLRDLCTLDYAEIADVLGIPPGTVRSRIARGRAQLAELLPAADRPERAIRAEPAERELDVPFRRPTTEP
jgi:RNA polymerase sigma-70 factor (ECF subfamily)